ncbi:hypothetical protein [Chromatium okenii]|jgi:hypothetical protein|uniref:Uncharacterized protein n=1 Tax=Chromatium okenii TaxID=61644 RepID=A0A2S7XTV5_9GAMM|nr:hypothetical protein [Chromatium okenii]MBV5309322.1 hypothetical protein [Chromatium okenii]PQJ96832.1 hypothetical protein CXB77_05300 [Chromatium okenii]
MSKKEYVNTYLDAAAATIKSPNGTARLLAGFRTLKSGADAGVTTTQMRAMFPDLRKYSDVKIEAFIEVASDLVKGATIVSSAIFEESTGRVEDQSNST